MDPVRNLIPAFPCSVGDSQLLSQTTSIAVRDRKTLPAGNRREGLGSHSGQSGLWCVVAPKVSGGPDGMGDLLKGARRLAEGTGSGQVT